MNKLFYVLSFFLFFVFEIIAQDQIDLKELNRNWKLKGFGNPDIPSGESFTTIYQFSKDGSMKFGSVNWRDEGKYEILPDHKLKFTLTNSEENWTIEQLTSKDLIIFAEEVGAVIFEATTEEVPELKPEIPEEVLPEKEIKTDYKPNKNAAKWILGTWDVVSISGEKAPEGTQLGMVFKKENKIDLLTNTKIDVSLDWKFSADKKIIEVLNKQKNDDMWHIKSISKTDLTIISLQFGEIVMKKSK
jgi:hypothetical protein